MKVQVICECGRPFWIAESTVPPRCPVCGQIADMVGSAGTVPPADVGEVLVLDFMESVSA